MHDIGLVEDNIGVDNFEIEKTYVARNFCIHNGMEVSKADLVYEMVALHNSVTIAHKLDPEIVFCIMVLWQMLLVCGLTIWIKKPYKKC